MACFCLLLQVQEVVLVEVLDAAVSHVGVSWALSSTWGSNPALTVLHVQAQA